MPENIGSITLVAPVFNVADAIARVGSHAIAIAHSPDRLIKALEQNRAQHSRFEMFWRLVEEVWAVPDVLDIYWAPGSIARKKWLRDVVEREPWLDFNTFMVILEDFWKAKPFSAPTTVAGPVSFVFGKHDVLVDATHEAQNWLRYFPDARVHLLNTGHYVHLEASPELWLRPRS